VDNSQTGSSGQTFGAMSAITAGGQNVTASVVNSTEGQVSFTPNSNGSFRVVIASPEWTGGNATTTASNLIGSDATAATSSLLSTQSSWWNGYWANSGLIQATSSDGSAQYMGEPLLRRLRPQPADLQHVPQRPARHRILDHRPDGRPDRRLRP
jgi:hypothetical protein